MSLHQRRIGNNIVEYIGHKKRLVDARGPDVIKFIEDFAGAVAAASDALVGWTTTLVEAGGGESTVTIPDGSGGTLLLTTDANENDGVNLQKIGENFSLAAGMQIYFGIRFKVSEKTESDFIVGLCITNTTLLAGMTDGVYFRKVDGSAAVAALTEKDSSETATASVHTMADDTYVTMEFYFDGTNVQFFVDGVLVATHTATIPDDELLTPSIHFLTGAAAIETMTVDWIRAIQIGR